MARAASITWRDLGGGVWSARPTEAHAECEGEVRAVGRIVTATVWRHDHERPAYMGERTAIWDTDVPGLVRAARARVEAEMQAHL